MLPVNAWLSGQQRRSCYHQADAEPDRDDQAGLPACHRPHLAARAPDEAQERQFAAALQREHRQGVDHGDGREREDDDDEEGTEPAVGLALGVSRGGN